MKNVQQLLDELGSPPPEICLDWAWQLFHLCTQPDCPPSFDWSNLQVSQQGSLAFSFKTVPTDRETTSTTNDPQELIRRLLHWAGLDENELSGIDTLDACRSSIESLTGQCVNTQTRSHAGTQLSRSAEKHVTSTTGLADSTGDSGIALSESATSFGIDEGSSNQVEANAFDNLSTQQSSFERPSKRVVKSKSRLANNRRLLLAAGGVAGVLLATMAFFVMRPGNSKSDALASQETTTTSGTSGPNKPSDSSTKSRTKTPRSKSTGSEMEDLLSGSSVSGSAPHEPPEIAATGELNTLGDEGTSESSLSQVEGTASASKTLAALAPNSQDQDDESNPSTKDASTKPNDQTASTAQGENTKESSQSTTNEADAGMAATGKESVAGLLKSVTSNDAKINTLDAGADQDGPPKLPVQLLNVESMYQVQELPAKIRVRQPVWQLRIASTAAFTVDPPGQQSLAEKEMVRWILTAKELKPRKGQEPTQVVVLAQLTGRKADIRWTVAAGSQDTPGIAVPLNESTLDQMLTVLQSYQQRLTNGIDQIKATVEVVEVPREQKALLTAQRRAMENEGKLVTRARQVIADASMFASWMDRSLEVHGVLTDQIGGQPAVVLELGQPVVAESKLKSDDSDDLTPGESDKEPANKK